MRIIIAAAIGTAGVADGQTKSPAAATPGGGPAPAPAVEKSKETSQDKVLTIRGRVVDAEGHAIAKAQLWLPLREQPPSQAEAVADEHGSFQLTVPDDLLDPIFWRNRREIWAHAKGHAIGRANIDAAFFDGSKDPIEIRLGPLTKTSFLVVDPHGKPVVGASVGPQYFVNRQGSPPAALAVLISAVTDDKGRAVLPAVSTRDLTTLRVVSRQHGTQDHAFLNAEDAPERTIRLHAVGRVEGQVIAPKPEWERGVKLIFKYNGGIPPAKVAGSVPPAGGSASVETDAEGKFVVPRLAAGLFSVNEAFDPRWPVRAVPLINGVTVTAGETTKVTIVLVPAVRVRGRVRLVESDKPLPGAIIAVLGRMGHNCEVRTDDKGRYEALVAPGEVTLNVYLTREYQLKFVPRETGPVGVSEGVMGRVRVPEGVETFDLPTIEMLKTIRYEGRLIDDDGKPVAEVTVRGSDGRQTFGGARTDRDGKFSLIAPPDIESYQVWINGSWRDGLLEKIDPLLLKLPFAVKQR